LLSPADMLIIGAAALLFFGPDQLPKVAKRAGQAMREVQNTSQAFIREIERAAEEPDRERDLPPPPSPPAAPPAAAVPTEPASRDSYEI
jgi:TatA/E family protein of Tat protein translocase